MHFHIIDKLQDHAQINCIYNRNNFRLKYFSFNRFLRYSLNFLYLIHLFVRVILIHFYNSKVFKDSIRLMLNLLEDASLIRLDFRKY